MKNIFGIFAILIGLAGYIPYFIDIKAGKTKPHAFSWFVWGLLTGIAFFAQLSGKGGAGAWVTGFTAVVCLTISALALKVGRKNIATIDWFFFAGSLGALIIWAWTNSPVGSVILITIIDALAFLPTFRKSFHKPQEETVSTYALSAAKFAVAIAALEKISITTALYPISLIVTNSLFIAMAMWRRQKTDPRITTPF